MATITSSKRSASQLEVTFPTALAILALPPHNRTQVNRSRSRA